MQVTLRELVEFTKDSLDVFLGVAAKHYRYSLIQLFMLYSQGLTVEEELAGWEYVQQNGLFTSGNKQFTCMVCDNPLTLFPVPIKPIRRRRGSIDVAEQFLKYTGLSISYKEGMEADTFVITENGEVELSTSSEDVLIRAAIACVAAEKKSIFSKDVVNYLMFKQELPEQISKLGWKELYQLLVEAFEWYQELVYLFKGKYFTIDEILQLNLCWDSDDLEAFDLKVKETEGILYLKYQDLSPREKQLLYNITHAKRLSNYPVFTF